MHPINFAVVKFSGCLTAGIAAAFYFPSSFFLLKFLPICLVLLVIIWWREGRKLLLGTRFGILTYLTFFAIGYGSYQLRLPKFQKDHYTHHYSENSTQLIQLKIREVLKADRYNHKYVGQLFQLDHKKTIGRVLLNIQKDTSVVGYAVDDILLLSAPLTEINAPSNPYQFNYKQYLKHEGIYHQLKISEKNILKQLKGTATLRGFSEKIRTHSIHQLKETSIGDEQRSILQALVLGERTAISKELRSDYAAAGALHMLAVSGLHVGIIFLVFSFLLKPLDYLRKGKWIKSFLLVICLWGFAFFTGLSPSVVRAVTMFSCFALAGALNRPTSSYNTLFLSFFVLLLFEPNWLFQVGFQLSYAAVFSILWIQPKIYRWYRPSYQLDRFMWNTLTVTLAAQLGIAPLSIFYFHQFPGLFFLTNLVVLPFLGLLLTFGLVVVVLATCDLLPQLLGRTYNWLLHQLNGFIKWIAQREDFLFEELSFSFPKMIICYLLIALVVYGFDTKRKTLLYPFLFLMIAFLSMTIWENRLKNEEQLVVFHKTKFTLLGYQYGRNLRLFQYDTINRFQEFPIKDFRIGRNINSYRMEELPGVFQWNGKKIVVLDSSGIYPPEKVDVIILTQSSKVHLPRLIKNASPSLIIADGSNYNSYIKRWKTTCENYGVPFHATKENGAYIFKTKKSQTPKWSLGLK